MLLDLWPTLQQQTPPTQQQFYDDLDPGFNRDLLNRLADAAWRRREEEHLLLLGGL